MPARRSAHIRRLCAAALLGSLVASCSTPRAGTTTTIPTIESSPTVVVAVPSLPVNFNPNTPQGSDFVTQQVMDTVWPQVFAVDQNLHPLLDSDVVDEAELIGIDPQTVQYRIDPKAVWSDGVPVSAQDFIYNWQAHAGIGADVGGAAFQTVPAPGWGDISSVVGSDGGKTVTVTFSQPYADWESLFADLVPAHVARRAGWNTGFAHFDPAIEVSAGPFVLESERASHELTLARNPRFWGTVAHVAKIEFLVVNGGARGMLQALVEGRVQLALVQPAPEDLRDLALLGPHIAFEVDPGLAQLQLVMDPANAAVANLHVREAIAHAIDLQQLASDSAGYLLAGESAAGDHLAVGGEDSYASGAGDYATPDPAAAVADLALAGYSLTSAGVERDANGATLTLALAYDSTDRGASAAAAYVQAALRDAGVTVELDPLGGGCALARAESSHAAPLVLAVTRIAPYPSAMAPVVGLSALSPPVPGTPEVAGAGAGGGCRDAASWPEPAGTVVDETGGTDPVAQTRFVQATGELGTPQADGLYRVVDGHLWQDMVALPLFVEPVVLARSDRLQNVSGNMSPFGPLIGAGQWVVLTSSPPASGAPGA